MAGANPIPEIVASTGLEAIHVGFWRDIPYGWADYLYGEPKRIVAKYLFTFTDAAQWGRWEQWGDTFITEIIEPTYFQLANDISWNLYWVSVLEKTQFNQIDNRQRISFSSNTEYTRNLILPLEQLTMFIPVGRISASSADGEIPLPSEIWIQELDKLGISFCLGEYSPKVLDAYVETGVDDRKTAAESQDVSMNGQRLKMLQSISIPKNFREHYYSKEWAIPLNPVNLLYGSNGTGKTSLLSAIELAITGEVRSLSGAEDSSAQADIGLTVELDGYSTTLHPPRTDAEKKRLERQWYKSRSNNRTAPQLKNLFHRFNYLSVEETFLFANQQPNLSDIFSKVLYGPETSDMWRHRGNYLDACDRLIAKFEQELAQYHSLIAELPEVPPADKTALRAYLSASELQFNPDGQPNDILFQAQTVLAEYDKVKDLAPISPQEQVKDEISKQEAQYHIFEDELNQLRQESVQAEELANELKSSETEMLEKSQRINDSLESIRTLEPLVEQLKFCIKHQESIGRYQKLIAQQEAYELKASRLQQLMDAYGNSLETPPTSSVQQIQEQIIKLQQQRSALKKELDGLQFRIGQEELAQERQTQLLSSLRATGLELYQMDKERHMCPLCGTDGITQDILLIHLEEESTQNSHQLQILYQKAQDLENEISKIVSELKRLNQQQIIVLDYKDAIEAIQQEFPTIQNILDLRQKCEDTRGRLNSFKKQALQAQNFLLEELRQVDRRSSIANILECRQLLLENLPAKGISISPDASNQYIIEAISGIQTEWVNQQKECSTSLCQIRIELEKQKTLVSSYEQSLEQSQKQLSQVKNNLYRLKQIYMFWEKTRPTVGDSLLSGETVYNLCMHICDLARSTIGYVHYAETKEHYQNIVADIGPKLERCRILKSGLSRLHPPEVYAEQFIRQNVAQISQIFLALHSPQEFSGLNMTADNELVAIRNDETVPISHMSTGQRTALVIAVFFQMNLATSFAPSFLLLDEPVANIDDLNVLALMDFLRELAITHERQIFFTTANRNVAKLFRRKFSFLLQDFQELRFVREKEHCLQIVSQSYDQSKLLNSHEL